MEASQLSNLFHRYLHMLLKIYCLMNDDMQYMKHFQCIAEYYARSRIDAIIADGTAICDLELTLGEVHNYITTLWKTDERGSRIDFTKFLNHFSSTYGVPL